VTLSQELARLEDAGPVAIPTKTALLRKGAKLAAFKVVKANQAFVVPSPLVGQRHKSQVLNKISRHTSLRVQLQVQNKWE
jgi:hypothetical protein